MGSEADPDQAQHGCHEGVLALPVPPKGDVEAVTKPDGTTRATYGYTAYGSDDEGRFTGADKPDAANPDKEAYNEYRYNAHRFDDGSGTYDMGFRNYDPGLNRFLTRDMFGGALADMSLAMDPYTGNRYAFAGGNPISFIELDGHLFGLDISLSDVGHAALDVAGMVPVVGEVADVANGIWYAAEGNYEDAALSMAAAVPGLGAAATAAKWAKKGAKAVDAVKGGSKTSKGTKTAKADKPKPKQTKPEAKPKKSEPTACKVPEKKRNSFVPGTKVLMADGSTKNIEDLKEGEYVLASDPETGNLQARQITDTRSHSGVKHLITLTVDPDGKNGNAKADTITATDEHPFWVPDFGKWVEAEDLEPGMWLQTSAGTWVQITAIDEAHRTQRVHNLTVDGQHTYYVRAGTAAVLVHNSGGTECGASKLQKRAQDLQDQVGWSGTTAVARVRSLADPNRIETWVASNKTYLPTNWRKNNSLKPGEIFIQLKGHAEDSIMEALDTGDGWEIIEGGTSTGVCWGNCHPKLTSSGVTVGGPEFGSSKKNSPWRMFWKK